MRITDILKPFMQNFGQSSLAFYRDRRLIDYFMDNLFIVPDEIKQATKAIKLSKFTAHLITPPKTLGTRTILFCHGGAMCLSLWRFYLPLVY